MVRISISKYCVDILKKMAQIVTQDPLGEASIALDTIKTVFKQVTKVA